jgi:hypothetical protein
VQRHARALVFENEPLVARHELAHRAGGAVQRLHREAVTMTLAARVAPLGAVLSCDRQLERVEQHVDARERASAHQRTAPPVARCRPRHEIGLGPLDAHVVGMPSMSSRVPSMSRKKAQLAAKGGMP